MHKVRRGVSQSESTTFFYHLFNERWMAVRIWFTAYDFWNLETRAGLVQKEIVPLREPKPTGFDHMNYEWMKHSETESCMKERVNAQDSIPPLYFIALVFPGQMYHTGCLIVRRISARSAEFSFSILFLDVSPRSSTSVDRGSTYLFVLIFLPVKQSSSPNVWVRRSDSSITWSIVTFKFQI